VFESFDEVEDFVHETSEAMKKVSALDPQKKRLSRPGSKASRRRCGRLGRIPDSSFNLNTLKRNG
jgi:hypothetical protein